MAAGDWWSWCNLLRPPDFGLLTMEDLMFRCNYEGSHSEGLGFGICELIGYVSILLDWENVGPIIQINIF